MPHALGGAGGIGNVATDITKLLEKAPAAIHTALTILEKAGPYLPVIMNALEDPALPQFVARIKTIKALETAKQKPSAPGTKPAVVGVGLKNYLTPFDAFIYINKYPAVPYLAGAGIVLVLFGIGFGVGRLRRKPASPLAQASLSARRGRRRSTPRAY